jgi:hydrogenase maturation protease
MTGGLVVLLGYGNPSRGDDGIGPELLTRVERLWGTDRDRPGLTLIQDFQLQVEDALDLQGADLALFLDASVAVPAPYRFTRVTAGAAPACASHQLAPAELLQVYRRLRLGPPPASYLLAVRGDRFDLGSGLAASTRANLEAAWELVRKLLRGRSPRLWDRWLGPGDA